MKLLKIFFKKNNYLISLIFFPFIYLLGWIIISILIYPFPILNGNKSLYGTFITFVIFLSFLPNWSKHKWEKNLSQSLGIIKLTNKNSLLLLIYEFFKACFVIVSICLIAIIGGYATFKLNINNSIFFNSIFLGVIVGFAEELVFRVWLFEELNLFFKKKYANFFQAFIFSIVHIRWDFSFLNNAQLLVGLFLLGLYLNRWRENKNSSILIPLCFHASIVSLWFLTSTSLINIQTNIPKILFGPGTGNQINPIGGLLGILILCILCFVKISNLTISRSIKNRIQN